MTSAWQFGKIANDALTPLMNGQTQARFEARARILKALAHPTRLFLVDQLSRKPRCVRELTRMVGADISTVSKHLSVLKSVGMVQDEKLGSQVFYRLRAPCVLGFFDCVGAVMESVAKEQRKAASPPRRRRP